MMLYFSSDCNGNAPAHSSANAHHDNRQQQGFSTSDSKCKCLNAHSVSNMANPAPVHVAHSFTYQTPPVNNNTVLFSAVPSVAASSPVDGGVAGAAATNPTFCLCTFQDENPPAEPVGYAFNNFEDADDADDVADPFPAQPRAGGDMYAGGRDRYAGPPYSFDTSDDGNDGDEDEEAGNPFFDASSTATPVAHTENSTIR